MKLLTIINRLSNWNKTLFEVSAKKQSDYLNKFCPPKDDFERSFFQFKCQMQFTPSYIQVLLNIISFIIYPFFILYSIFRKLDRDKPIISNILEDSPHTGIIPNSILSKYQLRSDVWHVKPIILLQDLIYLKNIIPYIIYSPYFVLKISYKVSLYSRMINEYHPDKIFVHNEFSFTSSILTNYCEKHKTSHINIMHGEKLFYIRDSFFRFSNCYVWDQHYVDLFLKLKAFPKQFIIEKPPFMTIYPNNHINKKYYSNYKYYLANYNEKELKSIISSLSFIKRKGKTIKYRPHPRYSDITLLEKLIPVEEIEYPDDVNIIDSISNTDYTLGLFSTVLNQAYNAGKKVILDDVTFKNEFEKLKNLDYILISKSLNLLSDY